MRDSRLGQRVRDKISGYEGVVVARTEWLWGCVRYGVRSEKLDKEGLPLEDKWFDEDEILVLPAEVQEAPRPSAERRVATGGPARATGAERTETG